MKWSVDKNDLNISGRKQGISGFVRVRNEEEWLGLSIESHIPFLDEIIIVYNRCTDSTPEIAKNLEKKYPKKIRSICYEPDVFPQGSQKAIDLPENSPHSLANYYNFALCQTSFRIALKVDGDQIAIPSEYKKMINFVSRQRIFPFYYRYRGINLYNNDGNVGVQGSKNFTGLDRGFFEINKQTSPWHYMDRSRGLEILGFNNIKKKDSGLVAFFHTKGLKKDMGEGNYDLKDNPGSRYNNIFKKEWKESKPLSWKSFLLKNARYRHIVPPEELGIRI
jgi:glycosyltransferase involved in cell wall biosynthesis